MSKTRWDTHSSTPVPVFSVDRKLLRASFQVGSIPLIKSCCKLSIQFVLGLSGFRFAEFGSHTVYNLSCLRWRPRRPVFTADAVFSLLLSPFLYFSPIFPLTSRPWKQAWSVWKF